jgi:Gas vesicle synthesis protein GvpL/GvpF
VLYVYAFTEASASLPDVTGIDQAPLETHAAGGLGAVVSRHDTTPSASEEAIVAHARVVEALAEANEAVLPARFGGVHQEPDALRAAIAEREPELLAALERVRGCVELGVRALSPPPERAESSSGAEYMRARLDERRGLEGLADELDLPLAEFAREATRTVGATERLLLSAAYLVPEDGVAGFRELVERLQTTHPELGIVCTGPWPPYSFATAEGGSS